MSIWSDKERETQLSSIVFTIALFAAVHKRPILNLYFSVNATVI